MRDNKTSFIIKLLSKVQKKKKREPLRTLAGWRVNVDPIICRAVIALRHMSNPEG